MNNRVFEKEIDTVFEHEGSRPSPPTPPSGWSGGEAKHSGGGVLVREWINENREIRVTYSLDELVVAIERIEWDDQIENWEFDGVVAQDEYVSCESDREAMKAAFDQMERINAGQIAVSESNSAES